MELLLTPAEQELLTEILEQRQTTLLKEIRHTDHRKFKAALIEKEKVLEALLVKIRVKEPVAA
ncbi:MAG: hypothetical protein ACE14M_03710 [Terriglobales bacterium]